MSASAPSSMASTLSRSGGDFRSTATERRPRCSTLRRPLARKALAAVLALVGLAVEADHVGPHVGQHHGAEGSGADAAELDDFQTLQGTAHALQLLVFGVQPSQRLRRR
jgi:hypothetical protein